ncbi:MAG TPA: aldo/keto reductase, partial [Candidatus Polarisedimenticolia bacterium]|nr:aldo/keto reductase [Candidatus Polarisedimenticolia bacterium]
MDQRQVGQTALRVTALGCGGAPLGNLQEPVSDRDGADAIDTAWANGCRYFDTAPYYGYGLSERRMGDGLRVRPHSDYVLSTKVGRLIRPGDSEQKKLENFPASMPFHAEYDYSYDGVMRSIEDSYQRLGLERVDILLMHDIERRTHGERYPELFKIAMDGGYRAMDELRRGGVVNAIGLGVNDLAACEAAMGAGDFDCFLLAGRYTLLEQAPLDHFFPACQKRGISIIIGGPFNSGVLVRAGRPDATYDYVAIPDAIRDRVKKLAEIAASHGVALGDAALQFC